MINLNGQLFDDQPMDQDQSVIMLQLLSIDDKNANDIWQDMLNHNLFAAQVIQKRCDVFKINLQSKIKIMATFFCRVPGEIVAYMIDVLESFGEEADFDDVISKLYPWGFYSEKGFEKRWDYLKENRSSLSWGCLI